MPGDICPIFQRSEGDPENITLIGAWMMHPQNMGIMPRDLAYRDAGHIAPMLASYTQNKPHRRINNERTDVGNGCAFEHGAFIMGESHPAPNEPGGAAGSRFTYEMRRNGDAIILVRIPKGPASARPTREEAARRWFTDHTARGAPRAPKEFDLFQLPNHPLNDWAGKVSADPWATRSCKLPVSDLAKVVPALAERFGKDHGIESSAIVDLLDEFLGAACPKCFGGMNGSVLQQVSIAMSAAGYMGGGEGIQRILAGTCATCESGTYHAIWHGDRAGPPAVAQGEQSIHQGGSTNPARSGSSSARSAKTAPAATRTQGRTLGVGAVIAILVLVALGLFLLVV